MSFEKATGSIERTDLMILVTRGRRSLVGTEMVARIASWSDRAGKYGWISESWDEKAERDMSRSREWPD